MTGSEMVTDFSLEGKTSSDLIKALNKHCKRNVGEFQESQFCDYAGWRYTDGKIPEKFLHLIAYCTEGTSEGWIVSVGALAFTRKDERSPYLQRTEFIGFGHCKTFDVDNAYALTREAQRFLTATKWN